MKCPYYDGEKSFGCNTEWSGMCIDDEDHYHTCYRYLETSCQESEEVVARCPQCDHVLRESANGWLFTCLPSTGGCGIIWKKHVLETMGDLLDACLACKTEDDAFRVLTKAKEDSQHAETNIGYLLGYVDKYHRDRLYPLFQTCHHPFFGRDFGRGKDVSPEEAIMLGIKIASGETRLCKHGYVLGFCDKCKNELKPKRHIEKSETWQRKKNTPKRKTSKG